MNDNDAIKDLLAHVLEANGFGVTKLPRMANRKSPDLLVKDAGVRYFIEVKSKLDDRPRLEEMEAALHKDGTFVWEDTARGTNRMSGIVEEAVSQLNASQPQDGDFRLIWFVACGVFPKNQMEQFISRLYGREELVDLDNPDEVTRPCFYFGFNEFYPRRIMLDGAIVGKIDEGSFQLNSLSPRAKALRDSRLYKMFGQAVCDPERLEAEKRAYLADCDVSRKDKFAVFKHLRMKYGKPKLWHFQASVNTVHLATVPVRLKDIRDTSTSST